MNQGIAFDPSILDDCQLHVKRNTGKILKIQYIRSIESDDEIVFPRLKRRLLQAKSETEDTFTAPGVEEITQEIASAKEDALIFAGDVESN